MSNEPAPETLPPAAPSFGRSLATFWLFTILRFGLFGGLWLVLYLLGVGSLIAAAIAVVLSVPLSWVLLARPRQAFAANLEQRVNARFERKAELDARLEGIDEQADDHPVADHRAGEQTDGRRTDASSD